MQVLNIQYMYYLFTTDRKEKNACLTTMKDIKLLCREEQALHLSTSKNPNTMYQHYCYTKIMNTHYNRPK